MEKQKLVASDAHAGGAFGAVAIEGDVAIIGDVNDGENGRKAGAAYVFVFDGVQWVETQKLVASDGEEDDHFGWPALYGDLALIGAAGESGDTGAAYAFAFDGVDWVETQKLVPSLGTEYGHFGAETFIAGDRALVAGGGVSDGYGALSYVFRLDGVEWVEEAVLAYTGRSFTGDRGITQRPDSIYCCSPEDIPLYRRDGQTWVLDQRFRGGPQVYDIELREDLIVVADSTPAVRMLVFDGATWVEGAVLEPSLEPGQGRRLASLALGDDVVVVEDTQGGADFPGAAVVFRFDGLGWYEEQKLVASDVVPFDGFGRPALWGDRLLVAAPQQSGPGAVYFFEATGPSVELKIGGDGAVYPHDVVAVEGPLSLTLDMKAGTDVLDHYYFWWTGGTFYWLTAGGVSGAPAPVATLAPVDLTDLELANTALTPGTWLFGWLMLDGSTLVDRDYIIAEVAP